MMSRMWRGRRRPGVINWRMGAMTPGQPGMGETVEDSEMLKLCPHEKDPMKNKSIRTFFSCLAHLNLKEAYEKHTW